MVYAMFLLTVLILYFTQFALVLQTAIAIIFTLAIFMVAKQTNNHSSILAQLFQFMAALILYLLTLELGYAIIEDQKYLFGLTTIFHALAWSLIGWKKKIKLFYSLGAAAFILGVVVLIR